MKTKTKLRLISLAMFVVAVVFVICALSAPTLARQSTLGTLCSEPSNGASATKYMPL